MDTNHQPNPSYCGTWWAFDHSSCPSSVECYHATTMCDACGDRPAGHGHLALYCTVCAA